MISYKLPWGDLIKLTALLYFEINMNLSDLQSQGQMSKVKVTKPNVIKNSLLWPFCHHRMYTVSQKNCAKLFLSELRQIFTNFDNFWQKDDKEAKIMRDALIFHLT